MPKIVPNLWFDTQAEQAAEYYASTFPDSRVDSVNRSPADYPSGKKGDVVTVDFTVLGQPFTGINGGTDFSFNEAVSFLVECEDQAEVDRYWDTLIGDGGEAGPCGWLKDKFGLSWQIVPRRLNELVNSDDKPGAERAMEAMLRMGKLDVAELEAAFEGRQPARAG